MAPSVITDSLLAEEPAPMVPMSPHAQGDHQDFIYISSGMMTDSIVEEKEETAVLPKDHSPGQDEFLSTSSPDNSITTKESSSLRSTEPSADTGSEARQESIPISLTTATITDTLLEKNPVSKDPEVLNVCIHNSSHENVSDSVVGEFIYRSKLPDIDIPNHLPLADYCLEKATQWADKASLIDGVTGREYTFGEVEVTSRKVAAGFAKLGIPQGGVIALLLPNCAEFVLVFLGAAKRGAIVTTANPFYTAAELEKQIIASGATTVVTQSSYIDKLAGLDVQIIIVDKHVEGCLHVSVLLDADESECPEVEIHPDDVVCLPYSSGTTGLPKGVMLTHKSLVSSVSQQVDGETPNLNIHAEDTIMCVLPMFHIYSLNSILLCGLRVGAALVIMPKFELPKLLELIQKYKVTMGPFVPPIVLAISKNPIVEDYDLSSVKMVLSGAAPLGKELEDAFRARLPNAVLGQGYGMTEAGPVLAMSLAFAKTPFPVKPGSCGTVVRNAEAKVIDIETGMSLPYNQPGEICIRGPQIMKGYLNNPEATANTIDKDGWLHTGDIAFIDEDEEMFIVDRVKEIIKFKGFQVPPAELEALLVSHESIIDAAVVPRKCDNAGEVPVAFAVRAPGSTISEDDVKQYIAQQVVFYKKLHGVYFIDSIPKSAAGKILRKDLRNKC